MSDTTDSGSPPHPRLTDTPRGQTIFVSLWVLGTLVVLALWGGAFWWGQSVGSPEPIAEPETEEVVEQAVEFPELGPPSKAPGTWAWDELRGGECIGRFSDAFAEEFDVVGCTYPHTAELVRAQLLSADAYEEYPGEAAVLADAREICDVRDLINIEVAKEYSDLRTAYSYPVTKEQWDAGERGVYCFVYSDSGESFTTSLR